MRQPAPMVEAADPSFRPPVDKPPMGWPEGMICGDCGKPILREPRGAFRQVGWWSTVARSGSTEPVRNYHLDCAIEFQSVTKRARGYVTRQNQPASEQMVMERDTPAVTSKPG